MTSPLLTDREPGNESGQVQAPEDEEEAIARQPSHIQVIVANNPLPDSEFPSNAPSLEETHLALASRPTMLESVDHLAKIMAESREGLCFSNFAEVSTPRNSARSPIFPTFTRFSSTRFAIAEMAEHKVIEAGRTDTGAVFDMCYPITLTVTDGRKLPLPGIPADGIPDSKGYPLFYSSEVPKKVIQARSSGALYPANVSRALASRMGSFPDPHTVRTWAHMFQLTNEKDAQTILLQRVLGSGAGDNHIALLLKAYLAYFDSIAGALDGVVPARNRLSSAGVVLNANITSGWSTQMLGSSAEIVNVLGGSPEYQEFWSYCSFDQPPIFAAKSSNGTMTTTRFSHYQMGPGISMVCICDCDTYSIQRQPFFFARPNLILGFIETYVQRFGLQQQANEAFQIAMLWPTLCETNAHISVPKALHATDWFGGEVEHTQTETPYQGLVSSSPFVVLASTIAGAWALRSQVYDFITLLTSKRSTWKLSPEAIKSSIAWLVTNASAPGVGWDFLLRHQFHITPSFLYLTGLSAECVDWGSMLSGFSWTEDQFPAHLRLLQPFWVKSSVCCNLPWERSWTPQFETSGYHLSATPATIMCMLRLGLLRDGDAGQSGKQDGVIFPILDRSGQETIVYQRALADQLRLVYDHGVKVLALCARPRRYVSSSVLAADDPADSRAVSEPWPMGGLLQNNKLQEYRSSALQVKKIPHSPPAMANGKAVMAARSRLFSVKENLVAATNTALSITSALLAAKGSEAYLVQTHCISEDLQVDEVYSPSTSEESGWWCALFFARMGAHRHQSMACLRRIIAQSTGFDISNLKKLSLEEMAGLCYLAQIYVPMIHCKGRTFIRREFEVGPDYDRFQTMLHLADGFWRVTTFPGHKISAPEKDFYASIDIRNMPKLSSSSGRPVDVCSASARYSNIKGQLTPLREFNLPTRVRILDSAIQRWDNRLQTTESVLNLHQELFPNAGLPRFLLMRARDLKSRIDIPERRVGKEVHARSVIMDFLQRRSGPLAVRSITSFRDQYAKDASACNALWPHRSSENSKKNNLSVADLLLTLDANEAQEALALWFVKNHQGNHGEFVTSVALWLGAVNLCESAWLELLSSGVLDQNEDTWLEFAQQQHDKWRKIGLQNCLCNGCWTQMLYIQALWGRGGVVVDWEKEISNKAKVPDDIVAFTGQDWSAAYASQIIQDTIRQVLSSAMKAINLVNFDDFVDRAYEWLVSGSAAGMPSAFKDTTIRQIILREYKLFPRPTKRSVMEKIPRDHILKQLESRPQIIAKLHQKLNETGGKARAIYGVTLWHYIFSNWLMAPFEKALDHENIDINIRNDRFVKLQIRRAQDAKNGAYFNSYDYPDFNSMHTHYHMSLIYAEAAKVVRTSYRCSTMPQADVDLVIKGYKWLEDSVFTQVCFLPGPNEFVQTVGGLYSGNRDTTLINTMLNIAYAKVVDVSSLNMGMNPRVNWRLCHGDDIITQHGTYGAALAWNVVAEKANLKGQEKKLLTDRSYHEYLRVMGCPDGKLRGSLARVVATFVNGNWETDYVPGAYAKVVELQATFGVLQRRGMRMGLQSRLWKITIHRLIKSIEGEDENAVLLRSALSQIANLVSVPYDDKIKRKGKLIGPMKGDINLVQSTAPFAEAIRREKEDLERHFLNLPDEVTRPYVEMLIASLPVELRRQENLARRLKIMLQRSTYGSELPKRFQIETKQTPQLLDYHQKLRVSMARRGLMIKLIRMSTVSKVLGEHKLIATVRRKIKAFHALLTSLADLGGYSKTELIASLTKLPEALVREALVTDHVLQSDWRRICRPSAAEVAALENELEMYLSSDGSLQEDEEIVIIEEDGLGNLVPLRDLMLY